MFGCCTRLRRIASLVTVSSVAALSVHSSFYSSPTCRIRILHDSSSRLCLAQSPFASSGVEMLAARFQTGDSYTWLYRRKEDGSPSSWERYTVVQAEGEESPHSIVVEMASKFHAEDSYQTHHRMTINLEQQLRAVYRETDWRLDKFEYKDPNTGAWIPLGQGKNVLAFEEKFNVFLMPPNWQRLLLRMTAKCLVRGESSMNSTLTCTQPLRHRYTHSFYGLQPDPVAGVALWKDFGNYTFALIKVQFHRDGVTQEYDFDLKDVIP